MTTIRAYTTIEQSKKLAEILPLESADMVYFGIHQGMDGKYYLSGTNTEDDVVPIYKNLCTKVFTRTTTSDIICMLPCWSLAALLKYLGEIKPQVYTPVLFPSESKWILQFVEYGNGNVCEVSCDNSVDACYSLIIKLNELNLL